jgi:hypothetical protein
MKCENCKYYVAIPSSDFLGLCDIKLPTFLRHFSDDLPKATRCDDSCDLFEQAHGIGFKNE